MRAEFIPLDKNAKAIHFECVYEKEKYPEDVTITEYASKLMGVPDLHNRIKTESVDSIIAGWQANLEAFKLLRQKYLLYSMPSKSKGVSLH